MGWGGVVLGGVVGHQATVNDMLALPGLTVPVLSQVTERVRLREVPGLPACASFALLI